MVSGQFNFVQVVALDSTGTPLGTSSPTGVAPYFSVQPASQTVAAGSTTVFSVMAGGTTTSYQWSLNGSPLSDGASNGAIYSGSSGPTLVVTGPTAASAGNYTCTATGPGGATVSSPAALSLVDTQDVGRLTNVSARANVGTGGNVLITGFVVGGPQAAGTEELLVRASGPSLSQFGITDFLPDPELVLTLLGSPDSATKTVASWDGNPEISQAATAVGAFPWENSTSLDAATVHAFHMGTHTAEVLGASGDTGIALAEVYDATPEGAYTPSDPHLMNVSARAQVGTGGNVLIAGFVIGGQTSKTVLIRASGPALAGLGVAGALSDPQVKLYNAASAGMVLASNSGWMGDPMISAAAATVGAFAWQNPASRDSALLLTLAPGSYTAEVQGQSGDTGIALVEIYEVP